MKISKHCTVGVKIDEGLFLSIDNTTREGEVSWERLGERKEHININTLGRNLMRWRASL